YGINLRLVSDGQFLGRRNVFTAGYTSQWGDNKDDRYTNLGGMRGRRTNELDQHAANHVVYGENQLYILPRLALVTGIQLARSERELDDAFLVDGDATFDERYQAASPKLGLRYEMTPDIQ